MIDLNDENTVMVEGIKQAFYYRSEDEPLMQAVLDGKAGLKPRENMDEKNGNRWKKNAGFGHIKKQ